MSGTFLSVANYDEEILEASDNWGYIYDNTCECKRR